MNNREMNEKVPASENRMGTMPVGKLMLSMGLPMIVSMMLQAVYNIVDSAFVSNIPEVGEAALNALTLAFPVQMLMVAIAIGTGVGANALVAKCLGQGESERASKTAGNAIFLETIIYLLFAVFGLFGVENYIASQSGNKLIADMAIEYLQICCVLSFGIVYFSIFEKLLQATGKSMYSTIAQISGAVVNIVLDPILIYGLFGIPQMGVRGAAWATVIGQCVSLFIAVLFHIKVNREIKNGWSYMKPSAVVVKGIYAIGLPAVIAQALMSLMTYLLNIIFVQVGENVVTAYGLYYKIQQFLLFAAFGLRDAITPIISFNYGKGSRKRVQEGIKFGMMYTLAIMLAGFVVLEIVAVPLAGVFGLTGETAGLCVAAIRIISFCYLFAGANIAFQGIFQALDSGIESLILSVCRQFLFVIPVAWGVSKLVLNGVFGTEIIWITFSVAEGLTVLVAMIFMRRIYRQKIQALSIHN